MDLPVLKQFVLWRGEKKLVVGEEDLQISKSFLVLKVSTAIWFNIVTRQASHKHCK